MCCSIHASGITTKFLTGYASPSTGWWGQRREGPVAGSASHGAAMARISISGDVDLRGGGGSILTTTHLACFRQDVFEAALAEQIQGGGAAKDWMGLLQPAGCRP